MKNPIDFYFDFSSPYGYLAAEMIEGLAAKHERLVIWRPVLLGVAFKSTGQQPMTNVPLKGDYAKRDFPRSARFYGVPFNMPSMFPISPLAATRAFYWLDRQDPRRAAQLARALYRAYFVDNINIANPDDAVAVAAKLGLPAAEVRAALNDPTVKDLVRSEVDNALARGVFGSPYVVIDGEPFWGVDRWPQIERWLETGGF